GIPREGRQDLPKLLVGEDALPRLLRSDQLLGAHRGRRGGVEEIAGHGEREHALAVGERLSGRFGASNLSGTGFLLGVDDLVDHLGDLPATDRRDRPSVPARDQLAFDDALDLPDAALVGDEVEVPLAYPAERGRVRLLLLPEAAILLLAGMQPLSE